MTERPRATTIGELDIHLGFVMDEIQQFKILVGTMATKAEMERNIASAVKVVADDVTALKLKVDQQSPRTLMARITEIAAFIAAVAAAIAILGWVKPS